MAGSGGGSREERLELKFRIYDGTDIAHGSYSASSTVSALKQRLVAEWPPGKTITPKRVIDLKLIHGGKILENSKTLADSTMAYGVLPGEVTIMHVVVQPPAAKNKGSCEAIKTFTFGGIALFCIAMAKNWHVAFNRSCLMEITLC
ncbi:hypothetical protein Tsubulata_028053 [Turnera subulata]|uniref:Ubiquitin-like domain-containing protein n=1 Tax=Turnera subulata TaxID=218843 RepID=A0A9Q0FIJ1_9ROSI|nr:hypothetical protein Tsubulata_028053 [Turnera subulata]